MPRRSVIGLAWSVMALVSLVRAATVAQGTLASDATLATRLPATVAGDPVELAFSEDLGTWLDTLYPSESHPEIEALAAALAADGVPLADVPTVTAFFGPDQGGQIQGFGVPVVEDVGPLQDAMLAAYLIGFGEMQRTERQVGDRAVTFLSEGPLDAEAYPFAVLPDAGVLWILNAEMAQLIDALEALLAVAAGTAPGHTGEAPPAPARIGPATWFGTMRETLTWTKGAYVGATSATFRGTWERIEREDISYCLEGPCSAYLAMGEIEWTFESAAPGPPACRNRQTGSVSTGDVVIPQDQMLFLEPAGADHVRYWGMGTIRVPPQDCAGWEGISAPGAFFDIPAPEPEDDFADVSNDARPGCAEYDWRIEADAPELTGTCWRYDEPGYEQRFEWSLEDADPR
jgi:hypothetical protein